jgi:hypothetical protein
MKSKKYGMIFSVLLTFLLVLSYASAIAVTTYYWDSSPLKVYPGQEVETYFELQNMGGQKDVTMTGELTGGSEIASLTSTEFSVPNGKKDVKAYVKIKIPSDAQIGAKYEVSASFKEKLKSSGEMMQMAGAVGASIPILVVNPNESTPLTQIPIEKDNYMKTPWGWGLVVLVIILILLVFAIKTFHSGKKH